jgi:hypothetical protein
MRTTKPTPVFPERYIQHVAYAVELVGSNTFLSPPAAVATVYLVTRFEFYFRKLSGRLQSDGTWLSKSARQEALSAIEDKRLEQPRISNVSLAYEIMMAGTSGVVPYCAALDRTLYASPAKASGDFMIANIGDRIAFGRHAAGHGHWGDISAEAVFYGLMTALIFQAQ